MPTAHSTNEQSLLIKTGSLTTASQITSEQCEQSKPGFEKYL